MKEVKQREQIEKLAKEIQQAYEVEKWAKEQTEKAYEAEKQAKERTEEAYEVEKKAKEELEYLDKAKNQFLLTIQHHLRTPLTSMMGYADLILKGVYGKQSKETREVIQKFCGSTNSLIKMVNEFLDITQFQLGKEVVMLKQDIQMGPMMEEIANELKFQADTKKIYLKLEKPKNIPPIRGDTEKLKAALYNIFDNAIKYTQKGGVEIKLKVENEELKTDNTGGENKILIEVKDTGIGMTKERMQKLFNSTFERGEHAKKEFVTGRGIGLYIASQIIKAHKGRVWAESEGEGNGSTFFIELPA
ncbi:MAG: ATP-binding protein, partial [bacterium]